MEKLSAWAKYQDLDSGIAASIKMAVKAKYEVEKWRNVCQPIQDSLREKKRDACVNYLIGQGWNNCFSEEDLYAYFLIDVEMCSCQLTSRIVQATNSVQLFVQRCFMNLESQVVVDIDADPQWLQWKWMKKYRFWQANRKVFLYPENWIEPELRLNKSQIFKDFEKELLQNELNDENIEIAYLNYLEKFEGISNLDVVGFYQEDRSTAPGSRLVNPGSQEDNIPIATENIVYVVAKTKTTPHIFYVRKWENNQIWTPWEKIDVDIKSEQILPVVYNKKLYIFWLHYSYQAKPNQYSQPEPDGSIAPPKAFWKIQMAYTFYRKGKWQAKRISKEILPTAEGRPEFSYHVKSTFSPDKTRINFHIYQSSSIENANINLQEQMPGKDVNHFANMIFDGVAFKIQSKEQCLWELGEVSRDVEFLPANQINRYFIMPDLTHHKGNELVNDVRLQSQQLNVNTLGGDKNRHITLFNTAPVPLALTIPHQDTQFDGKRPFFYRDLKRAYVVYPTNSDVEKIEYIIDPDTSDPVVSIYYLERIYYKLYTNYHCFSHNFLQLVSSLGVDGLINLPVQLIQSDFNFEQFYNSLPSIKTPYPKEDIDFSVDATYAIYNWEVFFHMPYLVANKLSQDQKFEDAIKWYQYIFNPTSGLHRDPVTEAPVSSPQRFWVTKPFYQTTNQDYWNSGIVNLMNQVADNNPEIITQINEWRKHPFDPHRIASFRKVAYQKNIFMKYIDTLIKWGDQLFTQDSMESINEATQLYIMASELLGKRPVEVAPASTGTPQSYSTLEASLDAFSNSVIGIENHVSPFSISASVEVSPLVAQQNLPSLESLYFCIPKNDKLLELWDIVDDRLYKIRHCLNIDGVFRQLSLFEPPIDPAILVKATAAGIDLGTIMQNFAAGLPRYRFVYMVQKAMELCNEIKSIGNTLLSVLEKKDAETLALLRSTHEIRLLQAGRVIKERQIDEAKEALNALIKSKEAIQERIIYYSSRQFMNTGEKVAFGLASASGALNMTASIMNIIASTITTIPDVAAGGAGAMASPVAVTIVGGSKIAAGIEKSANSLNMVSTSLDKMAGLASTLGGYQRRKDDWEFQVKVAKKDLDQINKQIAGSQIRIEIAEKDLANYDLQMENALAVDEYMHSKYTNAELYDWMLGEVSGVFFQSYKLAYEVARKAERTYRYELGLEDSSFINFGYWDSLRKGLLSGEKLFLDLKRMEMSYVDQSKRNYELTKHISLARFASLTEAGTLDEDSALMELINTGKTEFRLEESLFDEDYRGHYMRRIKSVSITIPCIAGPYTNVNATLTLLEDKVRKNALLHNSAYMEEDGGEDPRFIKNFSSIQSIATSSAQNDSGLFELNFRDERYLPFEGAGAISRWKLELPSETNNFDFSSITDVIIHVKYSASDGGESLRNPANTEYSALTPKTGRFLLNVKHSCANQWHQFFNNNGAEQEMNISLIRNMLPFMHRNADVVTIKSILIYAKGGSDVTSFTAKSNIDNSDIALSITPPEADLFTGSKTGDLDFDLLTLKIKRDGAGDYASLLTDELLELIVLFNYDIS